MEQTAVALGCSAGDGQVALQPRARTAARAAARGLRGARRSRRRCLANRTEDTDEPHHRTAARPDGARARRARPDARPEPHRRPRGRADPAPPTARGRVADRGHRRGRRAPCWVRSPPERCPAPTAGWRTTRLPARCRASVPTPVPSRELLPTVPPIPPRIRSASLLPSPVASSAHVHCRRRHRAHPDLEAAGPDADRSADAARPRSRRPRSPPAPTPYRVASGARPRPAVRCARAGPGRRPSGRSCGGVVLGVRRAAEPGAGQPLLHERPVVARLLVGVDAASARRPGGRRRAARRQGVRLVGRADRHHVADADPVHGDHAAQGPALAGGERRRRTPSSRSGGPRRSGRAAPPSRTPPAPPAAGCGARPAPRRSRAARRCRTRCPRRRAPAGRCRGARRPAATARRAPRRRGWRPG